MLIGEREFELELSSLQTHLFFCLSMQWTQFFDIRLLVEKYKNVGITNILKATDLEKNNSFVLNTFLAQLKLPPKSKKKGKEKDVNLDMF